MPPPTFTDTIVIGGGTAGAAVADASSKNQPVPSSCSKPDPITAVSLRATGRPNSWTPAGSPQATIGATPAAHATAFPSPLERARVIGGCSSHNGCAAIWGSRANYDAWASRGIEAVNQRTASLVSRIQRALARARHSPPRIDAVVSSVPRCHERRRHSAYNQLERPRRKCGNGLRPPSTPTAVFDGIPRLPISTPYATIRAWK